MNGVNVKITISLDVKMVKIATIIYKVKNKAFWFVLQFLINRAAKNLKNPTSSKNIDKKVIEKNSSNILIGLIDESENSPFKESLIDTQLKDRINIAPIKQIIQ